MGINVTGELSRDEVVDALESEVNDMNFTIVEGSIEWHPDASGEEPLVTFDLDELTPEQREALGKDPRTIDEIVREEVQDVVRQQILNLEDTIKELTRMAAEGSYDDGEGTEEPPEEMPPNDDPENFQKRTSRLKQVRQEAEGMPDPEDAEPLNIDPNRG